MSTAFFLAGFPHGAKRVNLGKEDRRQLSPHALAQKHPGRLPCQWPSDLGLADRFGSACESVRALAVQPRGQRKKALSISGIARVKPGRIHLGGFTHWCAEEEILFRYHGRPRDAVSLQIGDVRKLSYLVEINRSPNFCLGIFELTESLLALSIDRRDGDPPGLAHVRDVLAQWHLSPDAKMFCMLVPQAILDLIFAGQWWHLIAWCNETTMESLKPLAPFPPQPWLSGLRRHGLSGRFELLHLQEASGVDARFWVKLLRQLREWAPVVEAHFGAQGMCEDDVRDRMMDLETVAMQLQYFSESLHGTSRGLVHLGAGRKFSGRQLLEVVLHARFLRDMSKQSEAIAAATTCLQYHPCLQSIVVDRLLVSAVPRKSLVYATLLTADAALMMLMRHSAPWFCALPLFFGFRCFQFPLLEA